MQFRQTTSLASTWKGQRRGPATTVQNPRPSPRSKSSPEKSCNRSSRTKKTFVAACNTSTFLSSAGRCTLLPASCSLRAITLCKKGRKLFSPFCTARVQIFRRREFTTAAKGRKPLQTRLSRGRGGEGESKSFGGQEGAFFFFFPQPFSSFPFLPPLA